MNGRAVPIQRVEPGTGTVGIQLPLPGLGTRAVVVTLQAATPSSYRRHLELCPAAVEWRARWKRSGTTKGKP